MKNFHNSHSWFPPQKTKNNPNLFSEKKSNQKKHQVALGGILIPN